MLDGDSRHRCSGLQGILPCYLCAKGETEAMTARNSMKRFSRRVALSLLSKIPPTIKLPGGPLLDSLVRHHFIAFHPLRICVLGS
jgi:hypothetical protein